MDVSPLSVPLWLLATEMIGAALGAAIAHELTHAAAAKILGGHVRKVDLIGLTVDWEMPAHLSTWRDRLIGLAPQLVGGAIAAGTHFGGFAPGLSVETSPLYLAWGVYALHGGAEDFSLAIAHGREFPLEKHEFQMVGSVLCWATGLAILHIRPLAAYGRVSVVSYGVGLGLLFAALAVYGMSVNTWRLKRGHGGVRLTLPGR